MPSEGWPGAITRGLGRLLQVLLGIGLFVGYPAYAIWQSDWIALVPWAMIMLITYGMIAGPLPSVRRF